MAAVSRASLFGRQSTVSQCDPDHVKTPVATTHVPDVAFVGLRFPPLPVIFFRPSLSKLIHPGWEGKKIPLLEKLAWASHRRPGQMDSGKAI